MVEKLEQEEVKQEEVKQEEVKQEEVKQEETKAQQGQIYLVLSGVFEASVEVEPEKRVDAFLLHFTSLDGVQFMSPLICHENYKEGVRKALSRLTPLKLNFISKKEQTIANDSVNDVGSMPVDTKVQ